MKRLAAVTCLSLAVTFCAGRGSLKSTEAPDRVDLAQLWITPEDLESRDLFHGPGAGAHAPQANERYEVVSVDTTGYSRGWDVRDSRGRIWSVKVGLEAQPEVAVSRILWAIGYHQPPTYLVTDWRTADPSIPTTGAARFRPKIEGEEVVDDWSWYENPFVGTQPFRGLVVVNVMLNNWDWKTSNNKIYAVADGSEPRRRYVVRDLGASLGETHFPAFLRWTPMRGFGQGSRNDLEDFESQGFIKRVDVNGRVRFDYRGIHQTLVNAITAEDVAWAGELLGRLSDEQLTQAFNAAGYTSDYQRRYVAKLRSKIAQARALRS
jgi:hypothetical protein